ncbi:MAG: L,D-transpeptidase, partial [Actinobacteria bacterium]|nr:L,D-transpeptidase [Actinomycetota bacterium]
AVAVAAVVGTVFGVAQLNRDPGRPAAAPGSSVAVAPAPASARDVHVKLLNDPGATYGVGMPVIAYFSQRITDGVALQRATVVRVNGQPVQGAWYFEDSAAGNGPIEAHYRPQSYWPADASVQVDMPIRGLSAGGRLTYDDSLTLAFHTGAANIVTVNDKTHELTVTSDGKAWGQPMPVSLGSKATPTRPGIKVVMEKQPSVTMSSPGFYKTNVQYAQRLTYGGEYLHSAPWNEKNIDAGVDSSNGCTNLLPQDAQKLFDFLQIGDVVKFENVDGPPMQIGSGYGDWNVSWSTWLTGGLVPTR